MTDELDPLKEALRDSLHRHAQDAPRGDLLAERIIHTAQLPADLDQHRTRRGWRTWTLPLIAAGAVAAVVGAVVGIENFRPEASHQVPPGTVGPSVLSSPAPTQLQSPSPSPTNSPTTVPVEPGALTNVKITNLTFVGNNDGWALGSADCLQTAGRCTAMWRTTDGTTWTSIPNPPVNVPMGTPCSDPCVDQIRFANDNVGYAFGESAFFMTTDGGQTWQREPGGAIALETLDDNVIRVIGPYSGCPSYCVQGVETAPVGSSDWTPANIHVDDTYIGNVQFARGNGGYAYLLVMRNPAGGAQNETSTLYRSTDNGANWTNAGEPCTQAGGEQDSIAIAGGGGGRVAALCQKRGTQTYRVATSVDAGANFATQAGSIPAGIDPLLLTGDADTVLVAAGNGGMARSTDGGATWQTVGDVTGGIGWVGFESPQVGRAVSVEERTIWTTRDGGATWHPASIG